MIKINLNNNNYQSLSLSCCIEDDMISLTFCRGLDSNSVFNAPTSDNIHSISENKTTVIKRLLYIL